MPHTWLAKPTVGGALHAWLTAPGSLSWRIQARCPAFSVRRLRQEQARPHVDEAGIVGVAPGRHALVREVILRCGEMPVIFAHSVTRARHLKGPWRSLQGLGSRPLATMLYDDPRILRRPLAFRKLNARHPLFRRAAQVLPDLPAEIWARRSVFLFRGAPLLVTELFLPAIMRLKP
ncbi:MAG: chorismate lyase [Rhodocyclaceae bacterium]|nr:chorismate lyase [Rhodocyclaceae bacterium]